MEDERVFQGAPGASPTAMLCRPVFDVHYWPSSTTGSDVTWRMSRSSSEVCLLRLVPVIEAGDLSNPEAAPVDSGSFMRCLNALIYLLRIRPKSRFDKCNGETCVTLYLLYFDLKLSIG